MTYDIYTVWGETLDPQSVHKEYPRPQMVRESYFNLNGLWDYAITGCNEPCPEEFEGKILVPFSPETGLSGVKRQLQPEQALWYRLCFTAPEDFFGGRILLNFGAVDQSCEVFLNDRQVGAHVGGYLPFSLDVTDGYHVGENTLIVKVADISDTGSFSRGKQKLERGGIWYTAQSGIWQTVWMECVPLNYVTGLRITPSLKNGEVEITVESNSENEVNIKVYAARNGETESSGAVISSALGHANQAVRVSLANPQAWSPERPMLYPVEITCGSDKVKSYFAMRDFSVEKAEDGYMRLFLNGKPYFHTGLLDQGYWPDGLYTPPSDEAMICDIQTVKQLGFNMLRKHIKIEPLRWYYHCDRLGMLVWQDMVNGGGKYNSMTVTTPVFTGISMKDNKYSTFARGDAEGREMYRRELEETVRLLYNAPCIALWVPFNEGWGQFDALDAVKRIRDIDSTRIIDHASGWHDQGGSDVKSLHVYFKPVRIKPDERAIVLSEFGGYNYRIEGHCFNEKEFGYHRCRSRDQFIDDYKSLYKEQIFPAVKQGLCATVYTQVSDVEDEVNGLLTYDRKIVKIPGPVTKRINATLMKLGACEKIEEK